MLFSWLVTSIGHTFLLQAKKTTGLRASRPRSSASDRISTPRVSLRKWSTLVGGIPTPLKNLKVNWDDDIPNWMEKNHVPNHQTVQVLGISKVSVPVPMWIHWRIWICVLNPIVRICKYVQTNNKMERNKKNNSEKMRTNTGPPDQMHAILHGAWVLITFTIIYAYSLVSIRPCTIWQVSFLSIWEVDLGF